MPRGQQRHLLANVQRRDWNRWRVQRGNHLHTEAGAEVTTGAVEIIGAVTITGTVAEDTEEDGGDTDRAAEEAAETSTLKMVEAAETSTIAIAMAVEAAGGTIPSQTKTLSQCVATSARDGARKAAAAPLDTHKKQPYKVLAFRQRELPALAV
mmetsp:Transcript_11473/g.16662  ORF Transcript_11473/g.16662 Transcript_11473/m.16662 type:complete len:153 (+) Transcript_11473:227-685(+)